MTEETWQTRMEQMLDSCLLVHSANPDDWTEVHDKVLTQVASELWRVIEEVKVDNPFWALRDPRLSTDINKRMEFEAYSTAIAALEEAKAKVLKDNGLVM